MSFEAEPGIEVGQPSLKQGLLILASLGRQFTAQLRIDFGFARNAKISDPLRGSGAFCQPMKGDS